MLLEGITILPVNILQVAFIAIAGLSAAITLNYERFRGFAFFFLYYSILMLLNFYEETQGVNASSLYTPALTLVKGPIIYFSIRALVNDKSISLPLIFLHLIPATLAIPFTLYVQEIILIASFAQISYFIASIKLLNRYHIASMATQSDALTLQLNWMKRLLFILLIFTVVDLTRLNLQVINTPYFKSIWYFTDLLIAFFISCYLIIKITSNPKLFNDITSYENFVQEDSNTNEELDLGLAESIYAELEKQIRDKELYKQPRLSVLDVAKETGFKVKDISWSINVTTSYNFCEFINQLRIEEVKKQLHLALSATHNKSVLEIAFNSGFNSKSVFYSTFKSIVGMTPSQFKKAK